GDLFINESKFPSGYRMYHLARKEGISSEFINKIDNRLLKLIKISISLEDLEELLALEINETVRQIHLLAKAFAENKAGNPTLSAFTLNQSALALIPDLYLELYEKLLRDSFTTPSSVATIGMILPLTGRNAPRGKSFLRGFQKALKKQNYLDRNITLIIKDSRESKLEVVKAGGIFKKLPQISLIVGPLIDENVFASSAILASEQIPVLLPASVENGLGKVFTNIFQFNSNLEMRGKIAARYAVLNLGLDSLATIAPADDFGRQLVSAYITEVNRLGKTVVASEWYSGLPKDLRSQFKALRKTGFNLLPEENIFDEFLGMEIDSIDALFDVSADDFFNLPEEESQKLSSSDSAKIRLSTIQGIYMPIHPEDLEYIAPQFPMYYLDTKLIGNESWQNLDIINQENIGPHVKGLSIITNYFVPPMDIIDDIPAENDSYYKGYDLAGFIMALNPGLKTRMEITKNLSELDHFSGISQYYSSNIDNPNLNVSLQILEYNGAQFLQQGYFQGDSLHLIPQYTP
ncbi:MAG: penicillin-binding protein activator, partial [Candidatus Neomarinimicrobiota bacterium]